MDVVFSGPVVHLEAVKTQPTPLGPDDHRRCLQMTTSLSQLEFSGSTQRANENHFLTVNLNFLDSGIGQFVHISCFSGFISPWLVHLACDQGDFDLQSHPLLAPAGGAARPFCHA